MRHSGTTSPRQNPFTALLIRSLRRKWLTQTFAIDEAHMLQVIREYSDCYHRWRHYQARDLSHVGLLIGNFETKAELRLG